jgi:hypothetical protein
MGDLGPDKADVARHNRSVSQRLDPNEDCNELLPKPKGVHWRTNERLAVRYEAYDNQWSLEPMRRFGISFSEELSASTSASRPGATKSTRWHGGRGASSLAWEISNKPKIPWAKRLPRGIAVNIKN